MNHKRKSNILSSLLIVVGGCTLAVLLLGVSNLVVVWGNADEKATFESHYPAAFNSRIDACALCHTSAPAFNAYGQAYADAGADDAAFTAIENLDSDHDGFSNVLEIQMKTFPGDASDHPRHFFIPDAFKN